MKFLILFLSLSSFADCKLERILCKANQQGYPDYQLDNKICTYGQMEQDSSRIIKYTKNHSSFSYIYENNSKKVFHISDDFFYLPTYRPLRIKYSNNSIAKKFSIKNTENKKTYSLSLKEHQCEKIQKIVPIPGH